MVNGEWSMVNEGTRKKQKKHARVDFWQHAKTVLFAVFFVVVSLYPDSSNSNSSSSAVTTAERTQQNNM